MSVSTKLEYQVISDLAREFLIVLTDGYKRSIVEKLGLHPVNHGEFIIALYNQTKSDLLMAYASSDYRKAVEAIGNELKLA